MARGQNNSRGVRTRSGRTLGSRPATSTSRQAETPDSASGGHEQPARQATSASRGNSEAPPHIDPAIIFEMFTAIQNRMDGMEARINEKAAPAASEPNPSEDEAEGEQWTLPTVKDKSKKGVTAAEFVALKPPTFSGEDQKEDPQRFLDDCEKICDVLECPDLRRVTLVSYQLRGQADKWWRLLKGSRGAGTAPMTWNEFRKEFRDQYIPRSVRDARMREFETLRQGTRTVEEYHSLFIKLSEYAPHMVQTEEDRIWRFVEGLRDHLYSELGPNLTNYKSYTAAVDVARRMEKRGKDREEWINKRKRGQDGKPFPQNTRQTTAGQNTRPPQYAGAPNYQPGVQDNVYKPWCNQCNRRHYGSCYGRTCYTCGQTGHIQRDCPQGQNRPVHGPVHPAPAQPGMGRAAPPAGRGRGFGRGPQGRGQPAGGRGTARVYAINRQDAEASNAVVAGTHLN